MRKSNIFTKTWIRSMFCYFSNKTSICVLYASFQSI